MNILDLGVAFVISVATALAVTSVIIKLAYRFNVVDRPDHYRKLHKYIKPTMGGLAIFIGAAFGFLYLQPVHQHVSAIIIGACIMVITGVLDDVFDLKPVYKLTGQLIAAIVVVSSGLVIEKLTVPFIGTVYMGHISIILTILWIVGVSNAINFIDGLDGLAAGVSSIALLSILIMGVIDFRALVIQFCVILIGSSVGFLYHNFHPSKVFMGDTGSLFLGYSIAVVSMLGLFKNVALFSFIIPLIVIAIPVLDTLFAVVRRTLNKQSIAMPDKKHIHYQLMRMGHSHRDSVLIIYGFSVFFGAMAILFNSATLLTSLVIFVLIALGAQLIAELTGMAIHNRFFLLNIISLLFGSDKLNKMK